MKWPRGKYNGRRIVGFEVKFIFDLHLLTRLRWGWCFGNPYIWLGPFGLRAQLRFD